MTRKHLLAATLAACAIVTAQAQQPPDTAITTQKVAEGIYVLFGNGGNIGLFAGDDAVFMIDDQYAPMAPAVAGAVAAVSSRPVDFILNTHWHGDHTGGNESFGKAGALIVAHENVRMRMSVPQAMEFFKHTVPASPPGALPVVTFGDAVSFHLNGEDVRAFHVPHAHTDGDAVIHFRKANVIHAGDIFFNGKYPFIDGDSGGSIAGMLAAMDMILEMSDGATRIIPGHGPMGGRAELEAARRMLADTAGRVRALRDAGKSADEVVAAMPTADYDAQWSTGWFISPEQYARMLYALLGKE